MIYHNPFSENFFSHSHKTLTWGTFAFGGSLFILAVLIFAYPALIAYFFAGVILLAGITALVLAWKLWRFRENISHFEDWPDDNNRRFRRRVTYFRWHA